MSGFSRRHAFQAATPFLSIATCSSFAMEVPPESLEKNDAAVVDGSGGVHYVEPNRARAITAPSLTSVRALCSRRSRREVAWSGELAEFQL